MDIDLLFALLLLVFYLATQIFGRKKRAPQAPPREESPTGLEPRESHNADVEDALREIREALGWPSESQPEPAPTQPAPAPTSLPPRKQTPRPSYLGKETGGMNEWELAQERSERTKAAVTARYGKTAGIPEVKRTDRSRGLHPLAQKLRSPQGARDAVIYSEIFLPRWDNDVH